MTSDPSHTYGYDSENKIVRLDGTTVYAYDGEGKRVRKNVSGDNTRFIYGVGGELLAEYSGSSGAITKEYIYGASGLTAVVDPTNGTEYLTPDHLGSPRVVTNSSAAVSRRRDFMPFGEEVLTGAGRSSGSGWGPASQPRQKFTTYERDAESGLDFAQARHYGGSLGRFTSVDPLDSSAVPINPQTWNRYAYVGNNPLIMVDPTGEKAQVITEVNTKNRTVKITVRADIAFYGEEGVSDEYRDRAAKAAAERIANSWAGGFKSKEGYAVTVDVTIEWRTVASKQEAERTGMGNVVGLVYGNADGGDGTQGSSYVQAGSGNGPDYGRWNIGEMQGSEIPAHEFGHMLGVPNQSSGLMQGTSDGHRPWRATERDYNLVFGDRITNQIDQSRGPRIPDPETKGGARHNTRPGDPSDSTRITTVWAYGRW